MECTQSDGEVILRYRNRDIRAADLAFLREQCAQVGVSREEIARAVCAAWDWRQASGAPSKYACTDLLLRLQERGLIELPAARPGGRRRGPRAHWNLPLPPELIVLVGAEVHDPGASLDTLTVRPIAPEERLGWRLYMGRYHYLGDRTIVGEHLLYAAFLDGELVALLGWGSAALHAPLRDRYIGWDERTKRRRLHLIANNVRFLILPWVRMRHLASKVLAATLRRLSADWQAKWKHPVLLAETFVNGARFRGTCYRAANWQCLGQTVGRSKRGNLCVHRPQEALAPKTLFVYPLHRHALRRLRGEGGA
jgi:hypothetical protein